MDFFSAKRSKSQDSNSLLVCNLCIHCSEMKPTKGSCHKLSEAGLCSSGLHYLALHILTLSFSACREQDNPVPWIQVHSGHKVNRAMQLSSFWGAKLASDSSGILSGLFCLFAELRIL